MPTTRVIGTPNSDPTACQRKVRHATVEGAVAALLVARGRWRDGGVCLVAYPCQRCGGRHLGRKRDTN
jgi:hypothetical protein